VNGLPAPVSLLDAVTLTVESTNLEDIQSHQAISGFTLFDDRESEHSFRVPDDRKYTNLAYADRLFAETHPHANAFAVKYLRFNLTAKVPPSITGGEESDWAAGRRFVFVRSVAPR
jgi:hypothetical protein